MEQIEKASDAQLAREIEIALPVELGESLGGPDLEMLNRIIATFSH